ncbi:MAG TPA: lytic murein transglycosylase B [Chromatiales bacterium]|nr:lytic murein transglycosylase B [Chromatiales bacterium]
MTLRIAACIVALTLLVTPAHAEFPPQQKKQIDAFVKEMVKKHHFKRGKLEKLLYNARFQQKIIDAMERPAEAKPWYEYRPIFLTRTRIKGGVEFWNRNKALLESVAKEYGVPPQMIVAIIGVETRYGNHTGKHRILDSLSTLAFGYPKRARFFRKELEEFLLLAKEEKIDPVAAKGSYAGAMGKPQFIASSYRKYAVDYDRDGKRDLWRSNADVIASIANYFKKHGWQRGQPVTMRAQKVTKDHQKFVEAGMKPTIPTAELLAAGVRTAETLPAKTLVSLIELESAKGRKEYWVGLPNFYAITRYNHSNLYAMAAYQLSEEIQALKEMQEKGLVTQ